MKHEKCLGIVLRRTNFGEADRIITILTNTHGKISVMARGVRKEKSKLAGGIELLSVSDISFIRGKRDIGTLVSSRLKKHYRNIVRDINRTNLAFEIIKSVDKVTESECESTYFDLLEQVFIALNDSEIPTSTIESWTVLNLLKLQGHEPNLITDNKTAELLPNKQYSFDFDHMAFFAKDSGEYTEQHIKLLRLMHNNLPEKINNIQETKNLISECNSLLKLIMSHYIR